MSDLLAKVCGLTRKEDLLYCQKEGVHLTGFIFIPTSPRYVSPALVAGLPLGGNGRVGVFAGEGLDTVRAVMGEAKLDYVQLHGDEDPDYCRAMGPDRVIKTLWPMGLSRLALEETMAGFAPHVAFFLLDSGSGGGGSGKAQDWSQLYGLTSPKPWLLAGGLGPGNLEAALSACHPRGVDLNSGLEDAPGQKNHLCIENAMKIVRNTPYKGGLPQ